MHKSTPVSDYSTPQQNESRVDISWNVFDYFIQD